MAVRSREGAGGRGRRLVRMRAGLVAAALLGLALLFALPSFRAAAQSFLDLFHAERIAPIAFDPRELASLPAPPSPDAIGRLTWTGGTRHAGLGVDEAKALLGTVPLFTIAADGWSAPGGFDVTEGARAVFVLDRARFESYLRSAGWADARLPAAFDGATFVAEIPAVVTSRWADGEGGTVELLQGATPRVEAPAGVDVEILRQIALAAPGLPPELRSELGAIRDWRQVLPVPVPKGAEAEHVSLAGAVDAVLVADAAGGRTALVWIEPSGAVLGLLGEGVGGEALLALVSSVQPAK
ncbi:MAG: hypothetical protein IRZ11_04840 [Clostridia bacterium]|nr:hypothetical protein [Clostridia bacterium]